MLMDLILAFPSRQSGCQKVLGESVSKWFRHACDLGYVALATMFIIVKGVIGCGVERLP
jgi:hypothetical protein